MSEKIVIVYLNNGNIASEVAKEVMFNRVTNDLIDEGKDVQSTVFERHSKRVLFEDGSKVELIPIIGIESSHMKGYRGASKIYVDESIKNLPNPTKYILDQLAPCCYENHKESLMFYSVDSGMLSISNIFESKGEDDNE